MEMCINVFPETSVEESILICYRSINATVYKYDSPALKMSLVKVQKCYQETVLRVSKVKVLSADEWHLWVLYYYLSQYWIIITVCSILLQ